MSINLWTIIKEAVNRNGSEVHGWKILKDNFKEFWIMGFEFRACRVSDPSWQQKNLCFGFNIAMSWYQWNWLISPFIDIRQWLIGNHRLQLSSFQHLNTWNQPVAHLQMISSLSLMSVKTNWWNLKIWCDTHFY